MNDFKNYFSVQFYDIRRSNTTSKLVNRFDDATLIDQSDVVFGNLTSPKQSGNTEMFTIKVPIGENDTTVTLAFALKAVDDVGLMSDVSNIVQATLREYIPPTGPPPTLPWTTTEMQTTKHVTTQTPRPTTVTPTSAKIKKPWPSTTSQLIGTIVAGFLIVFTIGLGVVALAICPKLQERKKPNTDRDIQGQTNVAMSTTVNETFIVSGQNDPTSNTYVDTPY